MSSQVPASQIPALPAPRRPRLRGGLTLAGLALAAVLAGCAQPAPPPAPPPPPPVPSVSLSSSLIQQASAYRAYIDRAEQISPAFTDGASVAESLKIGEAYEPHQLLHGAMAYGAIVALQDPGFRAGVRAYAADPEQRREIAYQIMQNPSYVLGISGSAGAAGLVMNALGEDGRKLLEDGRAVKQAAYDVQHYAWSKADVVGRDKRLALAKELSSTPIAGDQDITARLAEAVSGSQPLSLASDSAAPPYTPMVVRSMAVAALAALGYADDASLAQVTPLITEPSSAECLRLSKLNLYQCLAVAKPHYEDVFCLGQHALKDTGACLMKGVGVAEPPAPAALPVTHVSTTPTVRKTPRRKRGS
jgi:hypothetical protein